MSFGAALPAGLERAENAVLTFVVPAPNGCNLACSFCYIRQRQERATELHLEPAHYAKFIEDFVRRISTGAICIQGYEPLLPEAFRYTQEVLATGKRLGIPTSLVTNGTYLRQHVPSLAKLQPARIAVSLDSADADTHDALRGKVGAFSNTFQGLKFAVSVPVLESALVVTSVLLPKKRKHLIGMPSLLSTLGIDRWVINTLVKVGKEEQLGGPVGERSAIFEDLLALRAEADRFGIDMVTDDEFGRLSEEALSLKVAEIEALRIKRLSCPEGVYRLVPTGHCSKGIDILNSVHENTSIWTPSMDMDDFLASFARPSLVH